MLMPSIGSSGVTDWAYFKMNFCEERQWDNELWWDGQERQKRNGRAVSWGRAVDEEYGTH